LVEDLEYGDGWEHLVIKDSIKNIILGLVKNHERAVGPQTRIEGAMTSVDLVKGKGRGLIILLHGEPGVGKTSTAECVAAETKRPLFPITCGDLGDRAETVEANLETNFQLAHRWGCVLLLDEAE
jgi:ATP-dependent Lon protease